MGDIKVKFIKNLHARHVNQPAKTQILLWFKNDLQKIRMILLEYRVVHVREL